MRFEKKDLALFIPATLLAIAGLGPDDPLVIGPCLVLSWATFIFICVIHEGSRKVRMAIALVITLFLCGVGYRRFNSILHEQGKKKAGEKPEIAQPIESKKSPTGFLQFYGAVPLKEASLISRTKPLVFNVGWVAKVEPIHDIHYYIRVQTLETTPDADDVFLHAARSIAPYYLGKVPGKRIDIEEVIWESGSLGTLGPLSDRILSGTSRIHVYATGIWKDRNEIPGTTEKCQWLQKPKSRQLLPQEMVWHVCNGL